MSTGIEWTDETWNPLGGCSKVSPGCDNCYAIDMAHRLNLMQEARPDLTTRAYVPALTVVAEDGSKDWTGELRPHYDRLDQPLRWKKPRKIFVNSMSDLFHKDVPLGFITDVFSTMANAPQHQFQILTKRPQRMRRIAAALAYTSHGDEWEAYLWPGPIDELGAQGEEIYDPDYPRYEDLDGGGEQPLPNVWLGTSVETAKYKFRIDHLRETPAAVRFLSLEPLLGPLGELDLTGIDWVIVGGESGPNARPMHPDWVREIRDQCVHGVECAECRGAGINRRATTHGRPYGGECWTCNGSGRSPVPFLFKQWGNWAPGSGYAEETDRMIALDGSPASQSTAGRAWVRRHKSKKDAGRTLDGRTWNQYP